MSFAASLPNGARVLLLTVAWIGLAVLKNMAVHELALAVTYYGVTAESIASVEGDRSFSVCETRNVRLPHLSPKGRARAARGQLEINSRVPSTLLWVRCAGVYRLCEGRLHDIHC